MRIAGMTAARAAALAAIALLLAAAGGAYAAGAGRDAAPTRRTAAVAADASGAKPKRLVLRVAHGPVTAGNVQYSDTPPAGPSAGDVRTYYLPLTRPASSRRIGYLTGALTTTAIDKPATGMELRTADLVFVVGGAADQIVVGGVSAYAQSAPTVATSSVVTRPVTGGSGRYAGARGWCVTTHHANDTWTHVFHITVDRSQR
jgi:hypothetical protein